MVYYATHRRRQEHHFLDFRFDRMETGHIAHGTDLSDERFAEYPPSANRYHPNGSPSPACREKETEKGRTGNRVSEYEHRRARRHGLV